MADSCVFHSRGLRLWVAALGLCLLLVGGAATASAQAIYLNYSSTNFAGLPGVSGTNDGTGSAARFSSPQGIAVDGAGNFYVADANNNSIRKLTPTGPNWVVTTLAGSDGLHNYGFTNATGSAARFNYPVGVAVDSATNI